MDPFLKSMLVALAPVFFDFLAELADKSENTELDDDLVDAIRAPLIELIEKL